MRIGPLTTLISSAFGVPEPTVVVVARALREAGWLTSGARGVNAPQMTAQDAGRLSLALLTGESPIRVVEEFEFIRGLQTNEEYPSVGLIGKDDLPDKHSFEDVLTALFHLHSDQDRISKFSTEFLGHRLKPKFSISVDASRRIASIALPQIRAEYLDLTGAKEIEELYAIKSMTLEAWERIQQLEARSIPSDSGLDVALGRGMRVVRTITQVEVLAISAALFERPDD